MSVYGYIVRFNIVLMQSHLSGMCPNRAICLNMSTKTWMRVNYFPLRTHKLWYKQWVKRQPSSQLENTVILSISLCHKQRDIFLCVITGLRLSKERKCHSCSLVSSKVHSPRQDKSKWSLIYVGDWKEIAALDYRSPSLRDVIFKQNKDTNITPTTTHDPEPP